MSEKHTNGGQPELVAVTIDDRQVRVPKGTNLIEVAREVGVEIPHYCYHPHLSVAGNCRMCQVEIVGQPKLAIACNTMAQEGLAVRTQHSSQEVVAAQRATLEFLLINHPLDCTVCDQAGHCKLQDYYYTYNAQPSRFVEDKVRKVKAEVLGPEVIYDGERCIVCTRCVRFCDEVTETGELGVFNRGDRSLIGVSPARELNNPLAGSVVDLCPVGALTHRRWRFNTRIWYTKETHTICPGCSTGCNARVAARDGEVVQVKARLNSEVNREWMCDEGRYGFHRFHPVERLEEPLLRETDVPTSWKEALLFGAKLKGAGEKGAVFLSPFLTLEELWVALEFAAKVMGTKRIAGQVKLRPLDPISALLVSPDYAPNAHAFVLFGLVPDAEGWREKLAERYASQVSELRSGKVSRVLCVGDCALADDDQALREALSRCEMSVSLTPRRGDPAAVHLPCRTILEKSGVLVNRDGRLQRTRALFPPSPGALPEWLILNRIAEAAGKPLFGSDILDERSLFRTMTSQVERLKNVKLFDIGDQGMMVEDVKAGASTVESAEGVRA